MQSQLAVVSAEAKEGTEEVDYSNIWTPKKFDDTEFWFLKTGHVLCYFVIAHAYFCVE